METIWLELVLIAVAILMNGFFAGSEIALVSARISRLAQLRQEARTGAASSARWGWMSRVGTDRPLQKPKPTYPEEAVTEAEKAVVVPDRECEAQLSRRRDNVEALAAADTSRARVHALQPGQTASFQLQCGSEHVPGFIVNHGGRHYAYVNRCPHESRPLDWWWHKFLTDDGLYLICAVHSALFEQETGTCIAGPCRGRWLESLRIERDGDWLVVTRPE